jgi:hypothetical protein
MPQLDIETFRASTMIVARNGHYSPKTGHDHETARQRDRSQHHRRLDDQAADRSRGSWHDPVSWARGAAAVSGAAGVVVAVRLLLV